MAIGGPKGPEEGEAEGEYREMKAIIAKPPFHLVWLDTWAVSEITAALTKGKSSNSKINKAWAEALMKQIAALRKAGKIVVPIGDQLREIETGGLSIDEVHRTLADMSAGVSLRDQKTVKDLQTFRTMEVVASSNAECKYPWEDLFDDPDEVANPGALRVSVHLSSPELIMLRRATLIGNAKVWEYLRQECVAHGIKSASRLALELDGPLQAARLSLNPKKDLLLMLGHITNVSQPLEMLRSAGGGSTVDDLLKFLKSDEFKQTPAIRIKAELIAEKLTSSELIKRSDSTDIDEISSALPFCSVMVMATAMRDKVKDKLKLTAKSGVQVINLADLPAALAALT